MRCPICKQEIKDDSKFCEKCGVKIPRCSSCGKVVEKKVRFCVYDGTLLPEDITALLPEEMGRRENILKKKKRIWIPVLICVVILLIADTLVAGYILFDSGKIDFGVNKIRSLEADEKINKEITTKNTDIEGKYVHIYGNNPSDTSRIIADMLKKSWGIEQFDNMILVDKNGTSATFNAGYLAKENNAPILLIDQENPADIIEYIRHNLKKDGMLYLLGRTNSMYQELEQNIPDATLVLLYGQNRYETNVIVLQQTDISNKEVLVCCDTDYGIGISASATGNPVLLVGDMLTEEQKKLLSDNSCEIICVGNYLDFAPQVKEELKLYDEIIEYISGDNAYEISVNIAKYFFDSPDSIVLAYDTNCANSLCSASLSFEFNAPFITLNDEHLQDVVDYVHDNEIKTGYFLEDSNSSNGKNIDFLFNY